eukprot:g13347.t1 g13347   contig8:457977-458693(+)
MSVKSTRDRNIVVEELLMEYFGTNTKPVEEKKWTVVASSNNADEKHCSPKAVYEKENKLIDNIPDYSATKIQASTRGHMSKKKTQGTRQWVGGFVGMNNDGKEVELEKLESNLKDIRQKRKEEQSYCEENYVNDLHNLKDVVKDEEGFRMKVELREERIRWIADHVVSKNSLPDSFEGFYTKDEPPKVEDVTNADAKSKASAKGKCTPVDTKAKGKGKMLSWKLSNRSSLDRKKYFYR